jgi:diguanylate cyclase (GGDEF)-like protein
LEKEFRDSLRDQTRWSVCAHLCLGIALVLSFILIDSYVLERAITGQLLWVRCGALVPLLILAAILSQPALYRRLYAIAIQLLAPVFGISVVENALLDQPLGISFFPAVVLAVIGIYLLVGLRFYEALRSGLIILAAYLAMAVLWTDAPANETLYNGLILLFTNVIGATACYSMERLHRTHFLEARLLTDLANRDGLTGIHNRRALDLHLECIWQQATRERASVALLLIDIDHFKLYNDYYGHQAGDETLKQVARLLAQSCRRPLDFVSRYGGEEFAVVLYDARRDYVESLCAMMQSGLAEMSIKHHISPGTKQLTVSIGAACVIPEPNRSRFGFVQLADEALYEAKDGGRDRFVIRDIEYDALSTGSFRGEQHAAAHGQTRPAA